MRKNSVVPILAAAFLVALVVGCSEHTQSTYNLAPANRFFDAGQFDKAAAEYEKALKAEPGNAWVIGRLGVIYFDEGRFQKAAPYLFKGSQLCSSNLEWRVKLGQVYLAVGELKQAREQAEYVLKNNTGDPDAPELLAHSIPPGQLAGAQKQLRALAASRDTAGLETALGILAARDNQFKPALEYFQRALKLDMRFAPAYAALGNTYFQFKQVKKAGDAFKAASDCAATGSPLQTEFGEFEIQTADFAGAEKFFNGFTQKNPDYTPGWLGLAEVALDEKKLGDSAAAIKKVLDRDADNVDALVLDARLKLARSQATEAIAELEHLVKLYPHAPQIHYQLALAYVVGGKTDKAMNQLHETLNVDPGLAQAAFLLAQFDVQRGDLQSALDLLKPMVDREPDLIEPRLLLADVYRLQNDFNDAMAIYRQLEKAFPKDARVPLLAGSAWVQQFNNDAARAEFNRALQIDPNNISAQEELAQLDLAAKNFDAAQKRAQNLVSRNPRQAKPEILLAKILLDRGQTNQAEDALLKAANLPEGLGANLLLAQLYFNLKQDKDALDVVNLALTKKPDDPSLLTFEASVQSDQKDYSDAAATYEKLLTIRPNYSPALNNLAWLDSDHLGQLEKAYTLAQRAHQLVPNDPSTSDTLGWIIFKQGDYQLALNLFEQSAAGLPNNPEAQFHLALAYYMLDREESAQQQLLNALSINGAFPDRSECERCLNILKIDPATADGTARAALEKRISEQPNDPVAFDRLAAINERDHDSAKVEALCQKALKANPKNVKALVLLARFCESQDPQKALRLAKAAYAVTPNDPNVCAMLGHLALVTGNDRWAFSLLDEASLDQSTNSQTLFDLARAAFCLGKVSEAQTDMQNAVHSGLTPAQSAQARNFLDMITVCQHPK
ncbi:MAG: tetratricopeptide repeat protein, partial [Limisphaerales bacterium]